MASARLASGRIGGGPSAAWASSAFVAGRLDRRGRFEAQLPMFVVPFPSKDWVDEVEASFGLVVRALRRHQSVTANIDLSG